MKNFEFKKYPSITNVDSKGTINKIMEMCLDQKPWQVSLKIHGANFSVSTNGNDILCARKTAVIESSDGNFYGYEDVVEVYRERISQFYDFLKRFFPQLDILTLYGELFGGMYNHPDVKRLDHATKVQKGVNYCPHNDFFLFDVKINEFIVNKSFVNIGINDFGFIGAKPLYQGSFRECLEYPNEFPDPTHKLFDLPEIDDNVCEGVVIEPEEPHFFPTGKRVILKNKNEKFAEKASHRKQKKVQLPHEWSVEGAEECSTIFLYITENRLRNVLSHIGVVTDKQFGKIQGLFAKDVWEDYFEEREEEFNALVKKEQDLMKKTMQRKCAECIRPNFHDILEGEF